ncbi:MAG: hypothetical protein EZS28_040438 [Streblomastix strix]|uniref:Uncharacterized protein n=1 Tax=Streblomastix strix TaxID=222440 RepID=A0A5J4TZY7_9EUKA|nr:MAG: hypothetical protein EZS28_040438 [Streblomastix strix]
MGPARKSLFMAEKKQQSSSSQEQGPSAFDEDKKALLVLAFMPKPEIKAFWRIKVLCRQQLVRMTPVSWRIQMQLNYTCLANE